MLVWNFHDLPLVEGWALAVYHCFMHPKKSNGIVATRKERMSFCLRDISAKQNEMKEQYTDWEHYYPPPPPVQKAENLRSQRISHSCWSELATFFCRPLHATEIFFLRATVRHWKKFCGPLRATEKILWATVRHWNFFCGPLRTTEIFCLLKCLFGTSTTCNWWRAGLWQYTIASCIQKKAMV